MLRRASDALDSDDPAFAPSSELTKKLLFRFLPDLRRVPPLPGKEGWIIFARRADGAVQIVYSYSPKARLTYSYGDPLVVPGTKEIEILLHQHFVEDYIEDKWFQPSTKLSALMGYLDAFAGNFWRVQHKKK